MQEYINSVFSNNKLMPESKNDIERFSNLHSWYKHLPNFIKAYPLLIPGQEPRYSFDTCFTDANQDNFHWVIIMEQNMDSYKIKVDGKYQKIPEEIKEYMKTFPIYLSNKFSPANDFQLLICEKMCKEFWDGLQKNKLI